MLVRRRWHGDVSSAVRRSALVDRGIHRPRRHTHRMYSQRRRVQGQRGRPPPRKFSTVGKLSEKYSYCRKIDAQNAKFEGQNVYFG